MFSFNNLIASSDFYNSTYCNAYLFFLKRKFIFSCKHPFQEKRKNIINKDNQQTQQETKTQTQKNGSAQQDIDL